MYYTKTKKALLAAGDKILNGILGHIAMGLHDGPQFVSAENYKSENFYKGTEKFIDTPAKNGKWYLGYANVSLVPDDWKTHTYYLGGYFSPDNHFCNNVERVIDDMKARVIAIDDGSGRGISVFATVDCIGMTNADIRVIRAGFASKYKAINPDADFASINICSTHTHSCIDTEGLWTGGLNKIKKNFKLNKKGLEPEQGTDKKFTEFLREAISDAMVKACSEMTSGTMKFAVKDIGEEYFDNKNRPSATALVTNLTRFIFTPDDKKITPTIIASIAAHPDVAGLPVRDDSGTGRDVSGDYIYYCGEFITNYGYNFMFSNGAICAIYMSRSVTNDGVPTPHRYDQSARYGRELGKMILSMTKTVEEIENDEIIADKENVKRDMELSVANGGGYSLWYKNWQNVEESEVSPFFNIRLKEVKIGVTNPIIVMAGKLNLANYKVISETVSKCKLIPCLTKKKYSAYTEIGYFEVGNSLKTVMVPGEFCCDLLKGGKSLTADGSYTGKDFGLPCLWDIFGKDTAAMGLANDGIGYIVPDNDYVLSDFKNHYHEEISMGKHTASSIIKGFIELKNLM